MRLTSGVQRLMAPYIGMFIPWMAYRLRVACYKVHFINIFQAKTSKQTNKSGKYRSVR